MTGEPEIPSVWAKPRKREQPALSRAQIVAEAIALLDTDGIEALSMRKLGARMDAGATSLYRHVANRDELLELVVDEVYGEIRVPVVTEAAQWRGAVTACADSMRAMILRHPWIASLLGQTGLSYLGPNVMRLNESMLTMFTAAGFTVDEAGQAIGTVGAFVIGMGINEAAWLTLVARSGQTELEWEERLRPSAEQAVRDYPALRAQFASYRDDRDNRDPAQLRNEGFQYGLDRILDGLALRVS